MNKIFILNIVTDLSEEAFWFEAKVLEPVSYKILETIKIFSEERMKKLEIQYPSLTIDDLKSESLIVKTNKELRNEFYEFFMKHEDGLVDFKYDNAVSKWKMKRFEKDVESDNKRRKGFLKEFNKKWEYWRS